MHSTNLVAWALALNNGRVQYLGMGGLRGTSTMSYCTKHQGVTHVPGEGCTCARGAVRYFHTNHHRTSTSRAFNAVRRALGAVPWQEGGDLQAVA